MLGSLAVTLEATSAHATDHNETVHTSPSTNILSPGTTSSRIESFNLDSSALALAVQNADKSVATLRSPLYVSNTTDAVALGETVSSNDSFDIALGIMSNLIKF
jgi:hypothetical protein